MDGEELGGTFVISVDELGLSGLWSTIKNLVESRMPLQGLTLPNKVGKLVAVPRLPLTFVLSTDKRLLRLKQYSHSPVTWFRNPHTHLVLVSTADVHEYKSTTRAQLKRLTADIEKDWGGSAVGSEWLILYVRPFELEPSDKGAKKVFEKLCDDFGSKRRERVVRLDVPLRAFDGPAATSAGSRAGTRVTTAGAYVPIGTQPGSPSGFAAAAAQGAVWGFGTVGLDELAAGLRDSIRSAFEARQAAYDAEIRRLLNERREPKWSFTTLYLVKDSFALMLEGAGLWEDAFQEYVELEAVYLDCLETAAAAAASAATTPSEAAAAAIKEAADFGLTGNDTEDVASLLSSSWRNMRRLVLWKKCVQEFHFRQYLFAAQARVLLRLNRPVDVAERGLVFIQNFLSILAAREAAGQVKPWFKECWAFSACMSLITVITAFTAQSHTLSPDWEVTDLLGPSSSGSSSGSSGPQGPAAQAAMRQLMAAAAAEKAAAAGGDAKVGSAKGKGNESERLAHARSITVTGTPQHPIVVSPRGNALSPGSSSSSSSVPVLTASEWELVYVKDSGGIAAAAAGDSDDEEDVPPLDMAVLCGQAITPGNAGLLLAGEQRRELMDKLYNCLLGHLYHLARGELLRLGTALRLTEAAAAAGGASILQLGKAAFAPSPAAAAAAGQVVSHKDHGSGKARSSTAAAGSADRQQMSAAAGADLLAAAAAAGNLSPRMVAQLQELLLTPLCGYSQMINKYADGCSDGLAYEVHTPKLGLDADPLAAALNRRDSQSTASGFANSLINTALHTNGSNSSSTAATGQHSPTAAAAERLRRGNSSGSSTPKSQQQHTAGQHSRLSRATAEEDTTAAAAAGGGGSSRVEALKHADSGTNLATVSINATGDGSSSAAIDNAHTPAVAVDHEDAENAQEKATGIPCLTANAGSLSGAAGSGLRDMTDLPRVATHTRSVSALPASVSGSDSSSNKPSAIAAANGNMASLLISPRRLEALADSAPLVPSGTAASQRAAAAAAGGSLSLVHPGAAATAAAAVPGWVGEWRLQLALRSAAAFQELLLALSRRAGRCYAKSGRVRSSALIYADVAVMALQRGQVEQAARLLDRMQRIFTSEGWQLLLGALLPKLLAVQRLAAQPLLPFTAVAVLALPPAAAAASDRQAAYEELLSAVGAPYVMDQLTGMNGLGNQLGFSLDHKAASGQQQQQLVQLATHDAIQLRPAAGTYSHFFGNEAPENTSTDHMQGQQQQQQQQLMMPVLSPPARPLTPTAGSSRQAAAANGGAALLAVGDSFSLTVDVVSRLPGPVLLRHLVLSLVQLHKSAWLSSVGGNSIFASAADMSIAGGSTAAAGGGGLNLLAMDQGIGRGKGDGWGFSRASTLGLGGLHVPGSNDSPRSAVQRWQEGEELVSNKLRAAYTPGAAADTAGAAGAAAGSSGGYRCQLLSDGSVLLVPGINRLVFTISPVREGLYCLKQLRALLGSCGELLIGLPPPGALSLLAAAAAGSSKDQQQQQRSGDDSSDDHSCTAEAVPYTSFGSTGNAPEAVQIGGVTAAGAVVSEVVVARVLGPAPRLKLSSVLPEGCLPVSCTAWLGVLLSPLHDVTLWRPRVYILPNKLVTLAATTGPGVLAGSSFNFGLGGISGSTDSVTEQQQQQRSLNALPSFAAGVGGGQQQAAHWVFGVPLQQTATAAAAAGSSVLASAAAAGEGRWVCVRRGGCVDLGDFCGADGSLSSPLLLWMQVQVGHPQTLPATVRVTKPTVTAAAVPSLTRTSTAAITATATPDGVRLSAAWDKQHQQSLLQQQPSTPLSLPAAAAAAAAVKCIPESSLLLPSRPLDTAAEVSLQVEYSAGVWRSHASTLLLPLQQPAAVTAAAMQLPNGCIALNITVAPDADLSTSLLLMEVGLRPQYGLILSRSSSSGSMMSHQGGLSNLASGFSDVLPMRLFPGASAGLCFVLSRDQGDKLAGSFEDDGSSLLMISYVLEHTSTEQQVTDAATGLALPPPPSTVSSGQSPSAVGTAPRSSSGSDEDASADGGRVIPSSPAVAAADAAAAGRVMTMRLPFWLEIPSDTPSTAVASLRATLLGPFQGRVGQPLMLTWQIARTGHDEDHHDGTAGFDGVTDTSFPGFSHVSLSESLGEAVGSVSGRVSVEHDGPSSRSGDYDEVLCYEVTPGVTKPQGGSSQGDLLRASYQSPRHGGSVAHGFAAGLTRAQTSSLNPNEGIVWWEGSNPSGSVRLGRAAGSLATVEVVLVPIVAGRQLAPQLVMRSLPVGGIQPLDVAGGSVGGHEEGFIYIQP